ncbi:hypothetical protein L502_2459 [Bordetella holmesii CDC-H785-BH]|nr:hypothetical protein L503_2496 [Bordetella holmesii CDC-H809-BH]KCV07025.1 hypothetical protein L502_2459 [Bordetella holmesii CDC-H785-BH]
MTAVVAASLSSTCCTTGRSSGGWVVAQAAKAVRIVPAMARRVPFPRISIFNSFPYAVSTAL